MGISTISVTPWLSVWVRTDNSIVIRYDDRDSYARNVLACRKWASNGRALTSCEGEILANLIWSVEKLNIEFYSESVDAVFKALEE